MLSLATLLLASVAAATPIQIRDLGPIEARQDGVGQDCPGALFSPYIIPSKIVPVARSQPDKSFGNEYPRTTITPNDFCTITQYTLPASAFGKTCTAKLFVPRPDQVSGVNEFSGPGNFEFTFLIAQDVPDTVTYNSKPSGPLFPLVASSIQPGNAYEVYGGSPGSCLGSVGPSGAQPYTFYGQYCSNDTTWIFDQSNGPCFIGTAIEYSSVS